MTGQKDIPKHLLRGLKRAYTVCSPERTGDKSFGFRTDIVLSEDNCPLESEVLGAFGAVPNINHKNNQWVTVLVPDTGLNLWIRISGMERRNITHRLKFHYRIRGIIGTQGHQYTLKDEKKTTEMSFTGKFWPVCRRFEIRATKPGRDWSDLVDLWFGDDYEQARDFGNFDPLT